MAAIADLVQRERAARDAGLWDEMATYYHPESFVDVSWFRGDGAAFVEATRKNAAGPARSLHQMAPSVVTIKNDRALADTGCSLIGMSQLDGVDVTVISYVRLLWRARRMGERWLIAGLRALYISDMLLPRNPNRIPEIDEATLSTFRPSYRYLSYSITRRGRHIQDDLPGVDRPETVAALREGERRWLELG